MLAHRPVNCAKAENKDEVVNRLHVVARGKATTSVAFRGYRRLRLGRQDQACLLPNRHRPHLSFRERPFAPICRALDAVVVFAISGWHQADHDIPPGRHGWTRATLNNPHRLADLKAVGMHDSHVTLHKSVNPDTEDRAA